MNLRHLRSRKDPNDISDFAPVGKKHCEGKCDRKVIMTKEGPVVACNACKRIVIDNRK